MAGKFEIFTGKDKKHYFRLKASNGETILGSQGYASKAGCKNGIESVRKNANRAGGIEEKAGRGGKAYFVVKATNGQVVGTSQQYKSPAACKNGCKSVGKNAKAAKVID